MKSNPAPRLTMRGIQKSFGPTRALSRVDFSVNRGEIHALIGENGAGKSTLMKILAGVFLPDGGSMDLEGNPYEPKNPLDARRMGVGMIYQELSLVPHLSVQENIWLGREDVQWGFLRRKKMRADALEAMAGFHHGEITPEDRVGNLPLSMRQLVEIGRSLISGCRVIVFDEPTSSLSQADIGNLFEIIRSLKEKGISVIYISHFLEEVFQIADRMTVLRDGRVAGTRFTREVTESEIIELMVGRKIAELYPKSVRERGKCVLEVENMAGPALVTDATFALHEGEILGIFGLVGAGRTELLRALFGLTPVRTGRITIGCHSGAGTPAERWKQGVGYLSENRKEEGLAVKMSIADNITLPRLKNLGPCGLIFPDRQDKAVQEWISRFDIRCEFPRQRVQALSGGNQQKSALARLLYHDVDILLLDEPTKGIDVAARARIYEIINEAASQRRKAILIVSSDLPELLGLCDRIAVMRRGRLGPARPVGELDEQALMAEAAL